jgi:hypothetical protein
LDEQDFGEKKEINKRKKRILAGEVSSFHTNYVHKLAGVYIMSCSFKF